MAKTNYTTKTFNFVKGKLLKKLDDGSFFVVLTDNQNNDYKMTLPSDNINSFLKTPMEITYKSNPSTYSYRNTYNGKVVHRTQYQVVDYKMVREGRQLFVDESFEFFLTHMVGVISTKGVDDIFEKGYTFNKINIMVEMYKNIKETEIQNAAGGVSDEVIKTKIIEKIMNIRSIQDFTKDIDRLGPKNTFKFLESFLNNRGYYQVSKELTEGGLRLSTNQIQKIFKKYKDEGGKKIVENPYLLTEIDGIGFKVADGIALQKGIAKNSSERIQAAILYVFEQDESSGNTVHDLEKLEKEFEDLFEEEFRDGTITFETIKQEINNMLFVGDTPLESMSYNQMLDNKRKLVKVGKDSQEYYQTKENYDLEMKFKNMILSNSDSVDFGIQEDMVKSFINEFEQQHFKLNEGQRNGVKNCLLDNNSFFALSGYAGAGKTTTSKCIIDFYKTLLNDDNAIVGCCLSGTAANRLQEATNMKASTIHSLLGFKGGGEATYNKENKLPYKVVVIDESTMTDLPLLVRLLEAIDFNKTKVVFIGDPAQLAPVGKGAPFTDLVEIQKQLNKLKSLVPEKKYLDILAGLGLNDISNANAQLTEIMRTKGGDATSKGKKRKLLDIANEIRKNISKTFEEITNEGGANDIGVFEQGLSAKSWYSIQSSLNVDEKIKNKQEDKPTENSEVPKEEKKDEVYHLLSAKQIKTLKDANLLSDIILAEIYKKSDLVALTPKTKAQKAEIEKIGLNKIAFDEIIEVLSLKHKISVKDKEKLEEFNLLNSESKDILLNKSEIIGDSYIIPIEEYNQLINEIKKQKQLNIDNIKTDKNRVGNYSMNKQLANKVKKDIQDNTNQKILAKFKEMLIRYKNKNNFDLKTKQGQKEFINDLMIISPVKNGILGTRALNQIIKSIFNPRIDVDLSDKFGNRSGVGINDKVMNLKNKDYIVSKTPFNSYTVYNSVANNDNKNNDNNVRIQNGQTGIINNVIKSTGKEFIEVYYPNEDFYVLYTKDEFLEGQIDLANAITVHKSQGGEANKVICIGSVSHTMMLNALLLYVALTRGKEYVAVLGQLPALKAAIQNKTKAERLTLTSLVSEVLKNIIDRFDIDNKGEKFNSLDEIENDEVKKEVVGNDKTNPPQSPTPPPLADKQRSLF